MFPLPKFNRGDKIFAKVRGYPPWPAIVRDPADLTPNRRTYNVYFYGTKEIGICKEEAICSYVENRHLYGKPSRYKFYNSGVLQMDSELGLISSPVTQTVINENIAPDELPASRPDPTAICKGPKAKKIKLNSNKIIPQIADKENLNRLNIYETEAKLENIKFSIECCLAINNADPDVCLKYLDELRILELNPLIIKKHPAIIDMLMKLQSYFGNSAFWGKTEEEVKVFESKASLIRAKGKLIFKNIKLLFQMPYGKAFLEYFNEELVKFNKCTKAMSLDDFFRLTKDPIDSTIENPVPVKKLQS